MEEMVSSRPIRFIPLETDLQYPFPRLRDPKNDPRCLGIEINFLPPDGKETFVAISVA